MESDGGKTDLSLNQFEPKFLERKRIISNDLSKGTNWMPLNGLNACTLNSTGLQL